MEVDAKRRDSSPHIPTGGEDKERSVYGGSLAEMEVDRLDVD